MNQKLVEMIELLELVEQKVAYFDTKAVVYDFIMENKEALREMLFGKVEEVTNIETLKKTKAYILHGGLSEYREGDIGICRTQEQANVKCKGAAWYCDANIREVDAVVDGEGNLYTINRLREMT